MPGGLVTSSIAYTYDPLYRLTRADYNGGATYFHYTYDAVGNRQTEVTQAGTTTYTYDIANRLTSASGAPYSWSANGNLLSDGIWTYAYDRANRLKSAVQGANSYTFAYNGLGDRLRQTVNAAPTNYTLDLAAGLTQVLADGRSMYLYGAGRIGEQQAGGWMYHLSDALGSVRQLADASVNVTLARSYEPFGDPLTTTGAGTSTYGFTGEQRDGTGLVYLRARYYGPAFGRFLSRDPWEGDPNQPMSYNVWLYVYANPVNATDPTGLCVRGDVDCFDVARRLYRIYGWVLMDEWSIQEVRILQHAATEISRWFQRHGGGDAQARMRGAMAPAEFVHGGLVGSHFVWGRRVHLLQPFTSDIVIHEMGHILDNLVGQARGGSIYASISGGGPSDEMARFLGIDPGKCHLRFYCLFQGFTYEELIKNLRVERPPTPYSLRGPSEDFAETFLLSVTSPGILAQTRPIRSQWMSRFAAGLTTAVQAFEGDPYLHRRFHPVPAPPPPSPLRDPAFPMPDC